MSFNDFFYVPAAWDRGGIVSTVAAVTGGDSYHYYYGKKRPSQELTLFMMVKELLEAL